MAIPKPLEKLIRELSRLPTIGEKSATKLAYAILTWRDEDCESLSKSIIDAKKLIRWCRSCNGFSDTDICSQCSDENRNSSSICVVEKPSDVIAIERSGQFAGKYFVLHGVWSPLKGIKIENTKIPQLIEKVRGMIPHPDEIIIATNATLEGDVTANYIAKELSLITSETKVTRIALGLPKGGELEYADMITLGHALKGRREI